MIKRLVLAAIVFSSLSIFASDVAGQATRRVKFARGTMSTEIKGTVRGYAYRDYIVAASAGQMMRVSIQSSSGSASVFSVVRPGGGNLGTATQTDSADGELPVSGDYVIRVGMMRNDARRRGSVSNYTLSIIIE